MRQRVETRLSTSQRRALAFRFHMHEPTGGAERSLSDAAEFQVSDSNSASFLSHTSVCCRYDERHFGLRFDSKHIQEKSMGTQTSNPGGQPKPTAP
jgi:hypothetical protein